MKALLLKSIERHQVGKGPARVLRREGMVPCVLYGCKIDSVNLSVKLSELQKILKIGGSTQFLFDLFFNGLKKKVTIKELQKCPVTSSILHVDFYEVDMDRKIKVSVPLSIVGKSKGVELGGMLQIIRREVDVFCLPGSIPESISVDITNLDIGDSVHIEDISSSDEVDIIKENNFTVLTVLTQKVIEEENENELEDDLDKDSEEPKD